MRIALHLAYDGTPFCGWQSQLGVATVQDTLEHAISTLAGHFVRVHAAGRTDAGVHALAQIAHFDTETTHPLQTWVRGVNAHLPASIRVQAAYPVQDDFHARYSAISRSYQYVLYNAPVASALMMNKVGWHHKALNVDAMRAAAQCLIGEHDFSAFRAAACQAKTPIKTLHQANIIAQGAYVVFEFKANAFLHHQVRNMVGALVYVGRGELNTHAFKQLLQQKIRALAPPTFSPCGLYLTGVEYPKAFNLPSFQARAPCLIEC